MPRPPRRQFPPPPHPCICPAAPPPGRRRSPFSRTLPAHPCIQSLPRRSRPLQPAAPSMVASPPRRAAERVLLGLGEGAGTFNSPSSAILRHRRRPSPSRSSGPGTGANSPPQCRPQRPKEFFQLEDKVLLCEDFFPSPLCLNIASPFSIPFFSFMKFLFQIPDLSPDPLITFFYCASLCNFILFKDFFYLSFPNFSCCQHSAVPFPLHLLYF